MNDSPTRTEIVRRNIFTLLARHHMSQTQVSRAIGRERSYMNKILMGDRGVPLDAIDAIAAFFGVSPSQLIHEHGVDDRRQGQRRVHRDRRVLTTKTDVEDDDNEDDEDDEEGAA